MVGITSDAVNVRARIETESGDLANLSVAPPEADTDAATKQYVDEHVPEDVVTNSVLEEKLAEIVGQDGFTVNKTTGVIDMRFSEGSAEPNTITLPEHKSSDIIIAHYYLTTGLEKDDADSYTMTVSVMVGDSTIKGKCDIVRNGLNSLKNQGSVLVIYPNENLSATMTGYFSTTHVSGVGNGYVAIGVDFYVISPGVISTQAEENKTLRQEMEQLKQEMQDLQQQFTVLNSSVTAIVASAVEDAVSPLNTQLESLKSQYDTLNTEYEKTKETVSTLESSSSDYSSQISGLTTRLDTAEGDITNLKGAGYQTAEEVQAAITAKGYQTADQVNTAITGKGYQTASQVETAITGKGYQTATQVQTKIESYGYRTSAQVESAITSKGYITQATADGRYVNVGGDTMTGALNLPAPTAAANAATKEYLDAAEARVKALV